MASKRRIPRALSLLRPFSVNPRSKSSGSPVRAEPCLMMPSDLGWLPGVRGARPSGLLGERGENPPSASARHAKCTHARHMPLPPGSPGGSLRLRMDRYISGPGDNNSFPTTYSKNRRSSGSEIAVYRPCHHLDPKAETDVTQFESVQERVRREMRPWSIGVALQPQCSYACPSRASTFWRLASRGLVSPLVGLLLTPNARVLHEDRGEREVERLTVGSLARHVREHLRLAETVTASAHQVGQRDAARRQTQAVKSLPSCRDARLLLK